MSVGNRMKTRSLGRADNPVSEPFEPVPERLVHPPVVEVQPSRSEIAEYAIHDPEPAIVVECWCNDPPRDEHADHHGVGGVASLPCEPDLPSDGTEPYRASGRTGEPDQCHTREDDCEYAGEQLPRSPGRRVGPGLNYDLRMVASSQVQVAEQACHHRHAPGRLRVERDRSPKHAKLAGLDRDVERTTLGPAHASKHLLAHADAE